MSFPLMSRLANLLKPKIAKYASWIYNSGQAQWTQWNTTNLGKVAYGTSPYMYAAVSLISGTAAGVKLYAYSRKGGVRTELSFDDPANVLIRKPNELMGSMEFMNRVIARYLIDGQVFTLGIGPDTAGKAPPIELYPLGARMMSPQPTDILGTLAGYTYRPKGEEITIPPQNVCWWNSFNPMDDFDGLPQGIVCGKAIDTATEAFNYNKNLLQNGGVPTSVLTSEVKLQPTHRQALKDEYRKDFGSSDNVGNIALFDAGLKPYKIGMSPREMSWDSLLSRCANTIAIVFHLAPELLGDNEHKTYSNYQEARAALYMEAVLPLLDNYLEHLSLWLSFRFNQEIVIGYDADDIEGLEIIRKTKWARVTQAWDSDLITLNEAMFELDFPMKPFGDDYKSKLSPKAGTALPSGKPVGGDGTGTGNGDGTEDAGDGTGSGTGAVPGKTAILRSV